MNIAKAFVERNRLKQYISGLTSIITAVPVYYDKKVGNTNPTQLNGKSYSEMVDEIIKAKEFFGQFNQAIDEANIKKSRKLLNELEASKACLATIQCTLNKAENVVKKDIVYKDGQEIIVERELVVDVSKLQEEQKKLKKKIKKLEDDISVANAETEVILSDALKEYLENYDN